MAYREVARMQVAEVLRRHAAGESQRAIALATGLSRNTVEKYLRLAGADESAVAESGSAGTAAQVLARSGRPGPAAGQRVPRLAELEPQRERIERWLQDERLQLTRVRELLTGEGVAVAYTTLRRFVRQAGLGRVPRATVRLADSAPGEVAQMDFGRLGSLVEPASGKRRTVWALVVVLRFSRHSFVWRLYQQTLEAVIEGLERNSARGEVIGAPQPQRQNLRDSASGNWHLHTGAQDVPDPPRYGAAALGR